MKGLLGAATVIGSLMYGAGHAFKGQAIFYLHGVSFRNSLSNAEFGHLFDSSTRELPSVLSSAHYAALTQLPLTYPWAMEKGSGRVSGLVKIVAKPRHAKTRVPAVDSIRVDWFSLPIENFLDRMPLLRQRLAKASSPWAGNKSQSIEVSLCLPNQRDLDTWYEAVFALPLAWPDIADIDPHYLKKSSAHQLLSIRMQMGVSHMWGGLSPQWHLLKYHLWNAGPSYHTGRLEELMFMTLSCPHLIGKHGRRGNIPRKR